MRTRRTTRLLVVLVVAALFAAACGGDDDDSSSSGGSSGSDSASAGKALIIARSMDINSLDPSRAYCDTCQIFMTAVYETLVGLDKDNTTLIPRLATKWTSNADQTEFTFDLDPDAKFPDGSAVTSADVKFSWERLKGLAGSASYLASTIDSIETPDATTVVAKLNTPNSAFLAQTNASYMGILEKKVAEENGATTSAETDKAEEWFLAHSAGSGPFTLASYKSGEELRFKRNDAYWGEKASFPEVVIKQTEDAVTQRQQLEQGAVDIAMQLSTDVVKDMNENGLTIKKVSSFNFVHLILSPGAKGGEKLTPDVLKAIRYALDYDGLIDVTVGGAGRKQAAPIPNGFAGTDGLAEPKQDVAKAKELMNGQTIDLDATYPTLNVYGVDFSTAMQKVQTDLKAIGINLKLNPVEISVWAEKIGGDGIPVSALYFAPDHTDSSQYVQWFGMISTSQMHTWTKAPVNADEEATLKQAFGAKDESERADLYKKLANDMIDDGVIIPLVNPDLYLASSDQIEGMHYSACCNLDLSKLSRK